MRLCRPRGFGVLAIITTGFAVFTISGIMLGSRNRLVETVLLAWSGLALVTAEALWNLRPWAHAATVALQAAVAGTVAVGALALAIIGRWDTAFVLGLVTAASALALEGAARHVRDQMRAPAANGAAVLGPGLQP